MEKHLANESLNISLNETTFSYLIIENVLQNSERVFCSNLCSFSLKVEIVLFDYYESWEENT